MSALIRDAPIGQLIRWVTGARYLKYPEEEDGFQCPVAYSDPEENDASPITPPAASPAAVEKEYPLPDLASAPTQPDPERILSRDSTIYSERTLSKIVTRPEMNTVTTRAELEEAYSNATKQQTLKEQPSRPIVPQRTSDGVTLVDWYTTNDPENPQNWSNKKKGVVVLQIYLYTLAVYMGSAI